METRAAHARRLFDGIAASYGWPAELFSFGQYGRWRREAVRHLPRCRLVLDVATGTGLVARGIAMRTGARVVGLDQSFGMLAQARRNRMPLVAGSAIALPFPDATFDALAFTYLLRYVDDPEAVVRELARVVRPEGTIVSVEFGVPRGRLTRPAWALYSLGVFRAGTRLISAGWRDVGSFLGRSIETFDRTWPPERLADVWRAAGIGEVGIRRMSFGGGVVMWGRRNGAT
jgi:demethylmenaquinone methyltransferase/2-methoxy-6-polyprenyl-1,4-benzoquinol methylase